MLKPDLIVFDFDGVVADSELAANAVLAAELCEAGLPTTVDQSLELYMGRRWIDSMALMEASLGRPLPEGFVAGCQAAIRAQHGEMLLAVPGLEAFLADQASTPRCIASSSSPDWLATALARLGLAHHFGDHVFSAQQVTHGKPAPDLFLLAARTLGAAPDRCLVIEDSTPGVQAGRAAGMTVVGLLAGAHIRDGHAERLRDAGAHHLVASYAELSALLSPD